MNKEQEQREKGKEGGTLRIIVVPPQGCTSTFKSPEEAVLFTISLQEDLQKVSTIQL